MFVALFASALGVVAIAVAPLVSVVHPAQLPGVWGAATVVCACVVIPTTLAVLASLTGRRGLAVGLLVGSGVAAGGLWILDLQLLIGAIDANRLELFRPDSAATLSAGPGVVLVSAGHLLAVVAGISALTVLREDLDDAVQSDDAVLSEPVAARAGFLPSTLAGLAAIAAGAALFGTALTSSDPVVLAGGIFDSPTLVLIGTAVVAIGPLITVAVALVSPTVRIAVGAIVGVGFGVLQLAAARLVVGVLAGDGIGVGTGSVVATAAAVVLILAGWLIWHQVCSGDPRARTSRDGSGGVRRSGSGGVRKSVSREPGSTWHRRAGVVGIATGLLAMIGALLPIISAPEGAAGPQIFATRVALVAGLLLVVASVWLLLSEFAATVRPIVGVLWTAVVFGATGVLQAVVLAQDVRGVELGPGTVVIALALIGAVATGVLTWLAGSAERDELDMSDGRSANRWVLIVGGAGAAAAALSLGLPLFHGRLAGGGDFSAAPFDKYPLGWDAWGQVVVAVAVSAAVLVAARARPPRAAATLAGAALAMAVYLASWPLTQGRVASAAVGPGFVLGMLGAVLLVTAALLAGNISHAQPRKTLRK